MTDPALPPRPAAPYVTGAELAAHLGQPALAPELAASCAYAATTAVFAVVADPGWSAGDPESVPPVPANPVPETVRRVTLMVGAEVYKAGSAVDGQFQTDPYGSVPAGVSSSLLRKYGAMLAGFRRTSGMVG